VRPPRLAFLLFCTYFAACPFCARRGGPRARPAGRPTSVGPLSLVCAPVCVCVCVRPDRYIYIRRRRGRVARARALGLLGDREGGCVASTEANKGDIMWSSTKFHPKRRPFVTRQQHVRPQPMACGCVVNGPSSRVISRYGCMKTRTENSLPPIGPFERTVRVRCPAKERAAWAGFDA
jgi:hypothetical protein